MRTLLEKTIQHLSAGERAVWCVILFAEGSTPRGVGAKMAVFADGTTEGTIGGGAVEYEAIGYARKLGDKAEIRSYDLFQGGTEATGMVCGGKLRVGFIPFPPHCLSMMQEALAQLGSPGAHWLRLDVQPDGASGFSLYGKADGPSAPLLNPPKALCETLPSGTVQLTEPVTQDYTVYIFGGGHVSAALVPVLLPLGFPVTVIDPRTELLRPERFPGAKLICAAFAPYAASLPITAQDYAVVMTPGHENDLEVLQQLLRTPAGYIGCIGSKRKTAYVNQALRELGFSESDVGRIHAPIGLPIQAKTPEEIAISIAAELILHRAGG